MKMDRDLQNYIKNDAIATIEMEGLVGNMVVNINPGSKEAPHAVEGDILLSDRRPDVLNMMKTLNETNKNLAVLTHNLVTITENLSTGSGTVPRLLHDEKMANDLAASFDNVRIATINARQVIDKLNAEIDQIKSGKGLAGYLLHDEQLPEQLAGVGDVLDSLFEKRLDPVVADLEEAMADIRTSAEALKETTASLNSKDGLVHYLVTDSVSVDQLKATIKNVEEGTSKFNETMDALKANFLFRKYFKKKDEENRK